MKFLCIIFTLTLIHRTREEMAVTLEQIATYLDNAEFKYKHDEEKELIFLVASDKDSMYGHFIRAKDDGDIFEWQMQILDENMDQLNIKDHKYVGKVLSHILFLNYKTKFGTWEFNPKDGDIRLAVEIPLEDALMTENQFTRIMSLMLSDANKHADEIMHILYTGDVPEDNSEAEMLAMLDAMLARIKDSSTDDDNDGI